MHELTSCAMHIDGEGLESHARHGTVEFPVGCYKDDLSHTPLAPHWHSELEVLAVVAGTAEVLLGTDRIQLRQGEGAFINSGVIHAARQTSEGAALNVVVFHPRLIAGSVESVFWQEYLAPLLGNKGLQHVVLRLGTAWQQACLEATRETIKAFCNEGFGYHFRIREQLSHVICEIIRQSPAPTETTRRQPSEKAQRCSNRIKTMLQFIHEHFCQDIRLEDVAASANVSPSECLRCFHEVLDTTPNRYLRQYRTRQAARLLATSDLKVREVGIRCGFHEMSYFAKAFKDVWGCTPIEYRKQTASDAGAS